MIRNILSVKNLSLILIILLIISSLLSAKTLHEKSYNVSPGQLIEVETDVGDIRLRTWDRDEVYIKVLGNRRAEEKIEFDFSQNSNGVYVTAEKEGSSWFNWFKGLELKFDIKVPRNFNAYLYTSGGDIYLMDLKGDGELKTSGGDIDVENVSGNLIMKTSGGDIKVKDLLGDAEMTTSGGDITTQKVEGNASAKTSGGDIKMNVMGGKVYGSTSGGDITLYFEGENKGIKLKTSGGDVKIYASAEFRGEADLKTSGGDINVDVPNSRTNRVRSGRYEGEINGGGEIIECRTTGGDISIKKL